ncbi:MAG TPA: type II secretion system protein [Burkholderiales bacterium]|nr:type II secretion system protein [Burkholderiales bacterium]
MSLPRARLHSTGFSLIEMALVLAIIGFVLGGMMLTLSAQVTQHNIGETQNRLKQARDALIGFAIANGRLPCPATATSNGVESPAGGTACTSPYNGYLPAVTLGFQPVDSSGYAVDAWNNRIRYAVAQKVTGCAGPTYTFTSSVDLKANGVSCLPYDLVICQSATGTLPGATPPSCNTAASVTNPKTVVAIVFSTGKDFATPSAGNTDEQANLDGNALFVSHPPAPTGAPGGEFDDQFEWIPIGLLYGRMTAAGVLP